MNNTLPFEVNPLSCMDHPAGDFRAVDEVYAGLKRLAVVRRGKGSDENLELDPSNLAQSALAMADAYKEHGLQLDECRCWMWIAGSLGSTKAAEMLASQLMLLSINAPKAEADKLTDLAEGWTKLSRKENNMAQTVERGAAFLENVRDETKSRQSKPRTRRGTAGLIVVDTIGESGSKMGEILSNRYKDIVGKPVGWAGKLPAPGHVRDEMTKLWPWAAKVALEIERELAIMRSSRGQNVRLKPILLVGNAGSGKTTMAKWLSEQLGVKQLLLSCAGLTDNGGLTAIGREWTGARPSLIVSTMLENDQCNPFVILDEIDKVATSQQNGSMQDALLGMVESNNFFDTCLMTRVDLAGVTFVGTANDLKMVKGPLCDRFTILDVPDPRAEDFDVILENVRLSFAGERDIPLDRLPQLGDVNVLRGRKLFTGGGSIRGLRQFYSETIGDLLLAIEEQGQHMDYEETSQEGGFQEPTLTLVQ